MHKRRANQNKTTKAKKKVDKNDVKKKKKKEVVGTSTRTFFSKFPFRLPIRY